MTLLGDDLFSRQPFCQALKDQRLHFILVCKPESHSHLYATVVFLAFKHLLGTKVVRQWNGRYAEISTYRYTTQLPLTADPQALAVNWCEVTVTREDSGEQLYRNAFITRLWRQCHGHHRRRHRPGRTRPLEGGKRKQQCPQNERLSS